MMIMNMKKMLCYMLSSVFLLAILNSCGDDDDDKPAPPPAPTLADLEGDYTGDSKLDLEVKLTPTVKVNSEEVADGAKVVFKNDDEDNLEIRVTNAQLKVTGGTAVAVGGVFTFTVGDLTQANATDPIGFEVGDTGSVDITVGSGATAVSINDLALSEVDASEEAQDEIELTAEASLTAAQATGVITAFTSTAPIPAITTPVDVTITLAVTEIEEDE